MISSENNIQSLDDMIIINEENTNEVIELGKREFPIDQTTTQDECEAVITIPDENNEMDKVCSYEDRRNFYLMTVLFQMRYYS